MANDSRMNASELEQEIAATRSRVDMTLDSIQRKFSAGQLLDEALQYLKTDPRGSRVRASMIENPLPVLCLGAAAAWFAWSAFRAYDKRESREEWERQVSEAGDDADDLYVATPEVPGTMGFDVERPSSPRPLRAPGITRPDALSPASPPGID